MMTFKHVEYTENSLKHALGIIIGQDVVLVMTNAQVKLSTICRIAAERIFVWEDLFNEVFCDRSKSIIRSALRDFE